MARYIDADNLVERLKASPIFQNFGTDGYFIRDMMIDLVGRQPTADVVPRAELAVTSFQQAARNAALTDEVKILKAIIAAEFGEKLRGWIVREIFEEIEEIIDSHEITIGLVYDEGAGATTAIDRINKKIAELKKKYTEGE